MARTRARRDPIDIWPGFVDALSTLLLVIMFLLVVFMLAQFFMGQLLEGRDETVDELELELAALGRELELERETGRDLRRSVARLSADLGTARADDEDLELQLVESRDERDRLSERVALLVSERALLQQEQSRRQETAEERERRLAELEAELRASLETATADRETIELQLAEITGLRDETDRLAALRAQLEAEIDTLSGALAERRIAEEGLEESLAKSERERLEALARAQELSRQINALTVEMTALDQALGEKEAEIDRQSQAIGELGNRLSEALADRVQELSQFRSEFFGRLRGVLGAREDIRIVGDRFVFQSEVLFASGEAEIAPGGRQQLASLARTLREITAEIPSDLPWVLQVDGHTDKRPIRTPRFPSNWELSSARAISVARFLVSQGVPSSRVAARGLAEFQPLDQADSEEAYRRNRRIEIKLTSR